MVCVRCARQAAVRIAAALLVVLSASGAAPPPTAATSPAMGALAEVKPDAQPADAQGATAAQDAAASEPDPPANPYPEPEPDPETSSGSDVGGFNRDPGDAAAEPSLPPTVPSPLSPSHPQGRQQPVVTAAAGAAAALPAGSGTLDSATVQRIIERLIALHFLASVSDAQSQDVVTQAIKDFQSSAGISPTGTLDRDTIGRLTTP